MGSVNGSVAVDNTIPMCGRYHLSRRKQIIDKACSTTSEFAQIQNRILS